MKKTGAEIKEMETKELDRLTEVNDIAIGAFWAVVAKMYPECKTGDLDKDNEIHFDSMCLNMVQTWVKENAPKKKARIYIDVDYREYSELESLKEHMLELNDNCEYDLNIVNGGDEDRED